VTRKQHLHSFVKRRWETIESVLRGRASCDDANINGSMMFDDGHHVSHVIISNFDR
jgi:hypothetical protein